MTHFTIQSKLSSAACVGCLLLACACSGGAQSSDDDTGSAVTTDDTSQEVASNFKSQDSDDCDRDDCTGSGDYDDDDGDDPGDGDVDDGNGQDAGDDVAPPTVVDAGTPTVSVDAGLGSCGSSSPTIDAGGGDGG